MSAKSNPNDPSVVQGVAISFRLQYEQAILKLMQAKLDTDTTLFTAESLAGKHREYPISDSLARLKSFLWWRNELWVSSAWLRVHRGITSPYMALAINGQYPEDLVTGEWHTSGGRTIYVANAINRMMAARQAINELARTIKTVSQRPYKIYDYILPTDIEVLAVYNHDL